MVWWLFKRNKIGIDLGTANTKVFSEGQGIVLGEPSVIATDSQTGEVIAVGEEAQQMIGRTPGNIVAHRPMKEGVIADFDITAAMLKYFLDKVGSRFSPKPSVIICVPGRGTEVEKRAVIDAARMAGAGEAYLIEEPFAAAVGAELPVSEPTGSMVVDIGGGTTDVATISLGGIVSSKTIRQAGDAMDDAIISYIRNEHNLLIGERTAEQIKMKIGCADPEVAKTMDGMDVRGRDMATGLPRTEYITALDINYAITKIVDNMIDAVKQTLEETPPEIAADVIDRGIVLTGGGALLRNLADVMSHETEVPVSVADDPLSCVAIGTGMSLAHMDLLRNRGRNH